MVSTRFAKALYQAEVAFAMAGCMVNITDAMLLTGEDLDEQVRVRVALMDRMVGNLYPSIVGDEVRLLRERQAKVNRWSGLYRGDD